MNASAKLLTQSPPPKLSNKATNLYHILSTGMRKLSRFENGCRRAIEKPLYSAGIMLYRFGVRVASIKNRKAKLLDSGVHSTHSRLKAAVKPGERWIWIHAASLGEFEQGRPLMERIRREYPQYKIMLTFFSPSGYEVRKNYAGADCVCYLPFDTPVRVKRFLDILNPEMAIFVKYEFWRNYLASLHHRNIPTFLISGIFREGQAFFKHHGRWYSEWLHYFTHLFLQDDNSRRLLAGIGIDNTSVCGDTRFDRVAEIRASQKRIPLLETFTLRTPSNQSDQSDSSYPSYPSDLSDKSDSSSSRPLVMFAGSSWPADEKVYAEWFNNHPEVRLVIAPHEFDSERLAALKKLFRNGAVLMSEAEKNPDIMDGNQVMIIDCFGLLSSAYAYADFAYVGGAFGAGLHNINEAAVYDIPVIYGPNNKKFIEAAEMKRAGGGFEIKSADDFAALADKFLADRDYLIKSGNAAGNYIRSKIGASDAILDALRPYLEK